jgi:NADPH-dependent 2,4-dienoyl-CoA reductase/sulfur reductase-like enzyme
LARIDAARHLAILDNGREVAYDKLLLATGVSPRPLHVPGADLPNVYDLRTIEDADHLHNAIEMAKREGRSHDPENKQGPRGRVAIIGAGLLGVELAGVLTTVGVKVDLISSKAHPWAKFAGEMVGALVTRHLQSHGIAVHCNSRVARLEGDGRAQRVIIDDGRTIHCDFVVTAIGTQFNREMLRGTPINAEKHILVNERCQTNVQDIYAAGDCAAVLDPLFGKHRVLDHWDSARLTGTIAGANMAGDASTIYDVVNHFETEIFGLRASVWGEARHVAHRHTRQLETGLIEFGVSAGNRISQAMVVSATKIDEAPLQELVRRRLDVSSMIQHLVDPSVTLKALLS